MSTLRNYNMLLNICRHALRRRNSCWRLVMAARPEFRECEAPVIRRSFSRSSVSSQSAENTEDALPEELAEMRSRMSKLHSVVSFKGVALADYKRSSNAEQNVSDSSFLKDSSEYDKFEDSSGQVKSSVDSIGKGLRKHKDVDVLISMPYGHVRFDSMNRRKSQLQPESEGSNVVEDEIPSVKIVKDGQHVFSLNAMEGSEESPELACEDSVMDEVCQADSQRESEMHDVKHSVFDEQCFSDALQQTEEKQENMSQNTRINSEACDLKPNIFDEQYFVDVLQHDELKQAVKLQEDNKQRNSTFDVKPSLFDEQYFSDVLHHAKHKETNFVHSKKAKNTVKKSNTGDTKPNVFEEQHFGDEKQYSSQRTVSDFVEHKCEQNKPIDSEMSGTGSHPNAPIINNEKLSLIDEQYFGSYLQSNSASSREAQEDENCKGVFGSCKQISHSQQDHSHSLARDGHSRFEQHSTHVSQNESVTTYDYESAPAWKEVEDIIKESITDDNNTVVVEPITRREMKAHTRPQADIENPKTAYDLSMKIRQERRQKQSADRKQQTSGKNLSSRIV